MLRSPVGSLVPRQARKCQGHDAEGEGKGQPDNRRARDSRAKAVSPASATIAPSRVRWTRPRARSRCPKHSNHDDADRDAGGNPFKGGRRERLADHDQKPPRTATGAQVM
jgi:hypothetical protein